MKWKILIKFLYLIALLAYAASEGDQETPLTDSNPLADKPTLIESTLGD